MRHSDEETAGLRRDIALSAILLVMSSIRVVALIPISGDGEKETIAWCSCGLSTSSGMADTAVRPDPQVAVPQVRVAVTGVRQQVDGCLGDLPMSLGWVTGMLERNQSHELIDNLLAGVTAGERSVSMIRCSAASTWVSRS